MPINAEPDNCNLQYRRQTRDELHRGQCDLSINGTFVFTLVPHHSQNLVYLMKTKPTQARIGTAKIIRLISIPVKGMTTRNDARDNTVTHRRALRFTLDLMLARESIS